MIPNDYDCPTCEKLRGQGIRFSKTPGVTRFGKPCHAKSCRNVPELHHHHMEIEEDLTVGPHRLRACEKEEFRKWKEMRKRERVV